MKDQNKFQLFTVRVLRSRANDHFFCVEIHRRNRAEAFAVRCTVAPLNLFLRAGTSSDWDGWVGPNGHGGYQIYQHLVVFVSKSTSKFFPDLTEAEELDFEYDDLPCKAT